MYNQIENSKIFLQLLDIVHAAIVLEGRIDLNQNKILPDMEQFCHEADVNRLGPLFYFYYGEFDILPDFWKKKWATNFRAASAIELRRADELAKIYRMLASRHIECAPLKGAHLAYYHYPHPALRTMSDIDILIRPDDIDKAFKVLVEHQFSYAYKGDNSSHHKPPLKSPRGFLIELHSHIIPPKYAQFRPDILWQSAYSATFQGQPISRLSPEIYLLHSVNHAFRDNLVGGIQPFIDVAYIFQSGNIDFEKLKDIATKTGLYHELVLFLNVFSDFFPGSEHFRFEKIPPELVEDIRYLIFHFKLIKTADQHYIMLERDYCNLSTFEKIFFLIKNALKKPSEITQIYKCRLTSPALGYYYIYRTATLLKKLIMFRGENKSKREFIRQVAVCQQKINCYRNGNLK